MSQLKKYNYSETLEKGLNILSLFNENRQGLTLTETAKALVVNKTSISRYLNTYCKLGYLRKDPQTKVFKLGPRTVALAICFLEGSDIVEKVKPVVDRAHAHLAVHIEVGLLHGDCMYLLYRRDTKDTVRFRQFSTVRGLHFLTTGKAALAFLPRTEQATLMAGLDLTPKTANTITDKSKLRAELSAIRDRGYALNNEEYLPGLIAIGAPLINLHTSKVQGAVSFDTSTACHTLEAFEKKHALALLELACEISALLPRS